MAYFHLPKTGSQERGQGLVEYALILVLVAVVVIAILTALGPRVGNIFSSVVAALNRTGSSAAQPCVITLGSGYSPASLTIPPAILSKSVLSSGSFNWTGTGSDRLKNSTITGSPSNPTLTQFTTKTWRTVVTSAVGNCSPFPNK